MNIQTLKTSSALVLVVCAVVWSGGMAYAGQENDPGVQYVIRSDGVTQTHAAISIDNNVSTYVPLQPGDISYAEGDQLISPGLNYVAPVVSSGPAAMPPTLSDMAQKSAADAAESVNPKPDDVRVAAVPTVDTYSDMVIPVPPSPDGVAVGELVASVQSAGYEIIRGTECVGQTGNMLRSGALNIVMGDLLSDQIGNWARGHGYTVYWEADQYRAGGALTLNKDFEETLRVVRESLQQSGIDLTMTIYTNCVVRVTEAK